VLRKEDSTAKARGDMRTKAWSYGAQALASQLSPDRLVPQEQLPRDGYYRNKRKRTK
jgi:hypothetical protein